MNQKGGVEEDREAVSGVMIELLLVRFLAWATDVEFENVDVGTSR